ncbi:protein phosphatase 1 regulatory subunit 3E-like [Sphaerodactylus townsendi]|uniref:protein phosphatase 1 regulatory subunit 3E-like n=1 Tax=Sphaerodactylus townsendi TaxID=933632 RepID=UPI002025BBD7|nr:protein phosphatase 1 regulatory subunit 3E-like [Sphaerodactylus townsendi]
MEKAGSLHASVPAPPPRLYLPRHFSCSACLYGGLAERCKGGCSPEPEAVELAPSPPASPPPVTRQAPSPPPAPRSPSPPPASPSSPSASRGREPTVSAVPPSPTLRRRAKSLPTPGERGLRPALQQSPSRRKTVRFADSLGLELIAVRHFCQADVPHVPPPPAPLPASPLPRAADLLKTRKPPALGELEPVLFGPPAGPALEPLFPPQPGSSAGFLERVRQSKVRLEAVRAEAAALRGSVRVLNLAYEKAVSVRYTLNRWASSHEVPAAYLPPGHAGDGLTDRFVFRLPVGAGATCLEFALRYRVAGAEYWDNNDGHNYKLRARHRPPDASCPQADGGGAWIHFI